MKIPEELRALLREAEQGIVPKELKEKGWRYEDFPTRFSFEMWDLLLETMGKNNYQILVMSQGHDWIRGQFLISPEGLANLRAYSCKS